MDKIMNQININHPLYKEDMQVVMSSIDIELLKDKKILITGATGLIGSHLIDALMCFNQKGARIHIYAIGRNRAKISSRFGCYIGNPYFTFIEHDVVQPFAEDVSVDIIIPAASNTHPLAYSQHPIDTMWINIMGCKHALELAVRCNAQVLYLSSVEIYGNPYDNNAFKEESTGALNLSNARSCYTESKRSCEALCQSYMAEYKLDVKIVRLCRVFGPTLLDNDTKASSQFLLKSIHNEDIVLKSEGNQLFSYMYVTDAVVALLYILLYGQTGKSYNASNRYCNIRLRDFAQLCADYNGKKVVYELPPEEERKGYSIANNALLDNSALRNIGWKEHYLMADAVQRTIRMLSKTD